MWLWLTCLFIFIILLHWICLCDMCEIFHQILFKQDIKGCINSAKIAHKRIPFGMLATNILYHFRLCVRMGLHAWYRTTASFSMANHDKDSSQKVHTLTPTFITKPNNISAALEMCVKFERCWIFRLRTNLPRGLNAMDWTTDHSLCLLPYSTS